MKSAFRFWRRGRHVSDWFDDWIAIELKSAVKELETIRTESAEYDTKEDRSHIWIGRIRDHLDSKLHSNSTLKVEFFRHFFSRLTCWEGTCLRERLDSLWGGLPTVSTLSGPLSPVISLSLHPRLLGTRPPSTHRPTTTTSSSSPPLQQGRVHYFPPLPHRGPPSSYWTAAAPLSHRVLLRSAAAQNPPSQRPRQPPYHSPEPPPRLGYAFTDVSPLFLIPVPHFFFWVAICLVAENSKGTG